MSCSQFIEHEDEDKSDTLVIIVNGDGTVTVDSHTLERVLKQQCRAAVSVVKIEDSNEPDSQTEKTSIEKDEKQTEDKESFCHKVNLVVEGYYPPPPLNMNSKPHTSADSVVSSTVGTPPLSQTTADFLDLLSEGFEIPISQSNVQTTSTEGCIGDSLVDAFSEMAPEQLKQVETALHSEKAKQILGDDVTSVLDTLQMNEDSDDWVHFDHCYTNIYGNKKDASSTRRMENVIVQDSNEANFLTIKANSINEFSVHQQPETSASSNIEEIYEPVNELDLEETENPNRIIAGNTSGSTKLSKKKSSSLNRSKDSKITLIQRNLPNNVKNILGSLKDKRSQVHIISKVKRKSSIRNEPAEPTPSERIVKEDEVDGVKVFKPTRSDKRLVKPFILNKDGSGNVIIPKSHLVQSKLNFNKKTETNTADLIRTSHIPIRDKLESNSSPTDTFTDKQRVDLASENDEINTFSGKNIRKDTPRKQPPSVTPETFGPALFSTPDIIRKINSDDSAKEVEKSTTDCESTTVDDTGDIEERMSAIENGEAILDRIHMELERQNKEREKYASLSDDERLLSDLENSADESSQEEKEIGARTSSSTSFKTVDSNSEFSFEKSSNDKSENSDKDDVDYEDDPNKLWCICNKPHGNRFMICCDACDNWYHGSCVGVTRPMGEKMELNGTEWLCPTCKREKFAKERELKLKLSTRSTAGRSAHRQNLSSSVSLIDTLKPTPATLNNERIPNQSMSARRKSSSQPIKPVSSQLCIECKEKEAMPEALYCSNVCIIKHVINSLATMNSSQTEPLSEEQKIIVSDKKKDHTITGMRAPSVGNLREWLLEHPSYEIVRPSAFPMFRLNSASKEIKPVHKMSENSKVPFAKMKDSQNTVLKSKPVLKDTSYENTAQPSIKQFFSSKSFNEDTHQHRIRKIEDGSGNFIIKDGNVIRPVSYNNAKKDSDAKMKDKQRQIKLIPVQPLLKQIDEPKPVSPIVKKTVPQSPVAEKDKKKKIEPPKKEKPVVKKVELKRQESRKSVSEDFSTNEPTSTIPATTDIRGGIRKALNELFISRSKDVNDIEMTEAELTTLAYQVEEELFNLFKDTGNKYKIKYRSLLFNIKDPKNTLFRRISEKTLSPFELVRLTPEELASTELAQWREREAKHELDMIKKAELENLSQTKILVVKTHKGELEINSETLPTSITDIVVPDLQPDELPGEKDKSKKSTTQLLSKDKEKLGSNFRKDKESSKDDPKKDQDKDKDRHKKHDHRDRHKSRKHRHRSSERDRHRSRSRLRSRSQGRDKSCEKDSRKISLDKTSRRSRSSEKSRGSKNSSEIDRYRSRSKRRSSRSRSENKYKSSECKDVPQTVEAAVENQESTESLKTSEKEETSTLDSMAEDVKIAADLLSSYNAVDVDLSDMEPTSTVTIKTPPHSQSPELPSYVWKGSLIMPDVAKFHTMLKEVSGNCVGLDDDLESVIDCVGRINPDTVWEYIAKVKKSDNREILVVRFEVPEEEQRMNYLSLYSYLSSKSRMAVVGNTGSNIKDFYVMPLARHSPVPQVLLPLNGPGFEDYRSHMLLGVIVRSRRKRFSANSLLHHSSTSLAKKVDSMTYMQPPAYAAPSVIETDSFTPPHSPTSVFVNKSTAELNVLKNDEDEPYSPEDDEPYSPGALDDEHAKKSLDLEREMEEINRKIEEEKQKIESISSSLPVSHSEATELYSPTENYAEEQESSNVQLPEDLQKLLNSFSKRTSESASSHNFQADPIVNAYKKSADNDKDDDNDNDNDDDDIEEIPLEPSFSPTKSVEKPEPTDIPEVADEAKLNRDPRRKPLVSTDSFRNTSSQPPPPGMEDEFVPPPAFSNVPATSESSSAISTAVSDPVYNVPMQTAAAYAYTVPAAVPPYPPPMIPPHPQMYMAAPPVYPQPGTLPYTAIPPPQIYVPPPVLHHDPAIIPLPIESSDCTNPLKRKAMDDIDKEMEDDKNCPSRKSDSKGKKIQGYYSDSKSRRSDSKSPPRHKSSTGYDSHHRGYQRDDVVEYGNGGSSSRYGSKYSLNYQNRRTNYWKSGSGSSSDFSSGHKKYSDRSRRSGSREKSSRRFDNSKNVKNEWDSEIRNFESQQRDKSDHKKSDSSSKRN